MCCFDLSATTTDIRPMSDHLVLPEKETDEIQDRTDLP